MQKEKLEREKAQLEGALRFCERIRKRELDQLQAEQYLEEIEKEEKNGALFADFLSDYKAMARGGGEAYLYVYARQYVPE